MPVRRALLQAGKVTGINKLIPHTLAYGATWVHRYDSCFFSLAHVTSMSPLPDALVTGLLLPVLEAGVIPPKELCC